MLRHLQKKLQEMSEEVQKATIAVVDHQQKLMLARIRFADGVSELTLDNGGAIEKKVSRPGRTKVKRVTKGLR